MKYAVYSLHARATELIDGGYQLRPGVTIKLGEPLEVFDSMEEAEAWRRAMRGRGG